MFMLAGVEAFAQQQEQPDIYEQAETEADRLQRLLDLEDWQTFYVDSTLKANFAQLQIDLEKLQKAKVTNLSLYQDAKDRCWDEIDRNFKKWFTEKQWAAYLKSGAAKLQKQRAKRKGQK
jgi:hypothetical protein